MAIALAVQAALGIWRRRRLTTTHDEYWHLPVGLLNLRTGRFHFDNFNPPLCRMVAALPVALTSARTGRTDADHDPQGWGDVFVAENRPHYAAWFFLGRAMIVLISVLGGLMLAIWARELFGDRAGVWPLCCGRSSRTCRPRIARDDRHGRRRLLCLYALCAWNSPAPDWRGGVLFGGLLGLAQLAKFTCLFLYPVSLRSLC